MEFKLNFQLYVMVHVEKMIALDTRFLVHSMQIKNKEIFFFWLLDAIVWTGGLNVIFRIVFHMYGHGKWQEVTKGQNFHF